MQSEEKFRDLIDRSFVEEISERERQLLHDHIRDCDGCKRYVELTARSIRGFREFTFLSGSDSHAQVREVLAQHTATMRQPQLQFGVQFKFWTAFAAALFLSCVGSALVYQVTRRLAVPMHFDTAQLQAGVLIFWLLPSLCAALYLLAAPGQNRGMA